MHVAVEQLEAAAGLYGGKGCVTFPMHTHMVYVNSIPVGVALPPATGSFFDLSFQPVAGM